MTELETKIRLLFDIDNDSERYAKYYEIVAEAVNYGDFESVADKVINRLIIEFLDFEGPCEFDDDGERVDTGIQESLKDEFCKSCDYAKKILENQITSEDQLQEIIYTDVETDWYEYKGILGDCLSQIG